jgi:hypothetical protein
MISSRNLRNYLNPYPSKSNRISENVEVTAIYLLELVLAAYLL